jgi:hypothetical protein
LSGKSGRIAALSILFILSVVVTLAVLLARAGGSDAEPEGENNPVGSAEQIIEDFVGGGPGGRQPEGALTVQDFILPGGVERDGDQPYLLRPRLERWGKEQVDRFWIPLEEIALDLIRRENDRRIEKLFEGIP